MAWYYWAAIVLAMWIVAGFAFRWLVDYDTRRGRYPVTPPSVEPNKRLYDEDRLLKDL